MASGKYDGTLSPWCIQRGRLGGVSDGSGTDNCRLRRPGNFVDGKGNKYEGFFDKNMFNGKGVLCKKSGELLKGIFKDGEFVEKIDDLILEKEDVNNFEKVEKINDGEKVIEIKQKNDWQVAEIKIKQENENENNDVVKKETTNDLNNIEENDKKIDNIVKNNEKVKDNLNGISDIKKNEKQQ